MSEKVINIFNNTICVVEAVYTKLIDMLLNLEAGQSIRISNQDCFEAYSAIVECYEQGF